MINASTITESVRSLLKKALPDEYKVERGEYINMDPDKTPWVGVYRGPLKYDTATLGRGTNSWKAEFTIRIIVQASNIAGDASKAEDDLEGYIKAVLDIIVADKTLGKSVAMTNEINVNYSYNETESETVYFQNAEIELITEVRTQ